MRISRRGLIVFLTSAPALALASPCCGPIAPQGARLAALLDGTGVDHLWLAGDRVDWETGESRGAWNDGRAHTHCSAFVASVAKRLGIYVLRPPDHSAGLLANAQMGRLRSAAAAGAGWRPLPDRPWPRRAQTRAISSWLRLKTLTRTCPVTSPLSAHPTSMRRPCSSRARS